MDRITAMQVFAEVADRASLTEAARALDMSRAMVSRYLESIERWLGVRLLHRTTRRVSLTDAGVHKGKRLPKRPGRSSKPPMHNPRLRWPHRAPSAAKWPNAPDSRERTTAEQRGSRHAPSYPCRGRDCDVADLLCQRGSCLGRTHSSATR